MFMSLISGIVSLLVPYIFFYFRSIILAFSRQVILSLVFSGIFVRWTVYGINFLYRDLLGANRNF